VEKITFQRGQKELAKNVVVTVDDYLIRKDPAKYKKLLESKKEGEEKKDNMEISEIREMLIEVERLEGANAELETEIKELKSRIKELEGKNFELQMRLKKTGKRK